MARLFEVHVTLPIFTETPVVASAGSTGTAGQPNQVAAGEPSRGSATSTTNPAVPVLDWKPLLNARSDELKADRDWAFNIYSLFARGGDDEQMRYLVLPGDPWSKSRPRFTKHGRSYQPRDDRDAEQRLRDQLSVRSREPFPGNVMLACRFYRSSYQRIDTDNLLKHVCDSANGVWWADDSQVTLVLGEIQHDREHPRSIIMAANHESTLPRGADLFRPCAECGKPFRPKPGRARMATQRYCSHVCARVAAGFADLSALVACAHCGDSFRRRTSEQRFCSTLCARTSKRGVPKGRSRVTRCAQCGKELTHNRGGRCRDCWRAYPKGQPAPVQPTLDAT